MSALEYPREWFEVTRWTEEPKPQMVERETAHRLYWKHRGRQCIANKTGNYSNWYPTREEAQAVIDARNAVAEKRKSDERIKSAAPELLAALIRMRTAHSRGEYPEALEQADAAIAKAKGETP